MESQPQDTPQTELGTSVGSGTIRKTKRYILEQKRLAYAANPKEFRDRARIYRRDHRDHVNKRRRQLAAQKREQAQAAKWDDYQQHPSDKTLPWNEQLRGWFEAQPQFRSVRALARAVGVNPRSVFDWLGGKHPPVGRKRRKLYEITNLDCFRVETREKRPLRTAEEPAAQVLSDLVVRCGLSVHEIQQLRVSDIEQEGIRLLSGRLIRFGHKWEYVRHQLVDAWISLARPSDFLFFQHKPVNRSRRADHLWILRKLHAAGGRMRPSQTARAHHFAGDFVRMNSKEFLRHLRHKHGLSRSGASSLKKQLLKQKASAMTTNRNFEGIDPESAFGILYPARNPRGAGRKPKKTSIFVRAKELHEGEHLSWSKIARLLTPKEWAGTRKAAEAVRKGASRV